MALPDPQPGLVISYAYLWHSEREQGREEGRKDRPCVIILAAEDTEHGILVTVVPVTHSPPADPAAALELPALVKKHLGLDEQASWVILSEGNRFIWPGYDLKPIRGTRDRFDYGYLPPKLFSLLIRRIVALWTLGHGGTISRD